MIEQNKNLKELNTFMVPALARYYARVSSKKELYSVIASSEWSASEKHFILGSGSNILFTKDYDGFVLKNEIMGIDCVYEDQDSVRYRVGAGENWNDFVHFIASKSLWGIENLAYIPGVVGASPVQNIGAYGVEVASVISSVEYVDLSDAEHKIRFKDECDFSYRSSWFKKNNSSHIITHVNFSFLKKNKANVSYGLVAQRLEEKGISNPAPKDLVSVITEIRKTKLPELGEIGMAGSFFKNPVVSPDLHRKLLTKHHDLVSYDLGEEGYKIPAGWLLEKAGYKNFKTGNVGNYEKHALIETHNGKGSGEEVYKHVQDIIKTIDDMFSIQLVPEVIIL